MSQASQADSSTPRPNADEAANLPWEVDLSPPQKAPSKESSVRRSGSTRWRLLGWGMAVAIVGIAVWWGSRWFERSGLTKTDRSIPVMELPERLRFALGRLEPEGETVAVAAPDGTALARIQSLCVQEGERVQAGQVLAILDSRERLAAERDTARQRLDQATMRLEQTRIVVDATRQELEARLRSAEFAEATAQTYLDRRYQLARSSAISQEELDQGQRDHDLALQSVEQYRAMLLRYAAPSGGEAIDIQVAKQEVAVAESLLEEAEVRLSNAYVRAPSDGTVLEIKLHPGELLYQQPLLEFGATQRMLARIEVYETDVRFLALGQRVSLTSPALAEPLLGKVSRIAEMVKRQSIVEAIPAASTDARIVEVMVALEENASRTAEKWVHLQVRAEFLP